MILKRIAFQSILSLLIVVLYWGTFSYPYIMDDWRFLYYFDSTPDWMRFLDYYDPNEFYRPFGWLYFYFIVNTFGNLSIGFRILNLLVLFASSLVFKAIAFRLLRNEVLAWASAAWFVFSGTLLMDPLMWMVGMYDLGALLFFLLSILFFLEKKPWFSAGCYLAALLFKEGPFFLPVILFAYSICSADVSSAQFRRRDARATFSNILPHGVVMFLYVLLWFTRAGATEKHAYQVDFWGMHFITNFIKYLIWIVEGLTGRANLHDNWNWGIPIFAVVLALLLALFKNLESLHSRIRENLRLIYLLLLWGAVCLLPVLFLPNHSYRYYLIYSYPAIILLLVLLFDLAFPPSQKRNRIAVVFLILLYFSNLATLNLFFGRELKASVLSGSNALVQRGATVQLMLSYVHQELKKVPENSVFIFDGVNERAKSFRGIDPVSFRGRNFLRYIYHDNSIDYINLRENDYAASKKKLTLERETTVVLGLKEGKIKRYTLEDLYNPQSAFYTDN
ncbi:hypothetical protein L0222_25695 [bacterium]|nr:hypothetical protein [bacterium]